MLAFSTSVYAATINFFVGLIGLFIGIGGFWITLVQLSRVKSITKAQKEAINALKFRMAGFDAIQECTQAEILLKSVRDSVQKMDKPAAATSYDLLALCLINLSESGYVSNSISDELREGAVRISIITNRLTKSQFSGDTLVSKQLETSRYFHTLLMKARFYIQKGQ